MFSVINNCLKQSKRSSRSFEPGRFKSSRVKLKELPVFRYPISDRDKRRVYVWGLAEHGALGSLRKSSMKEGFSCVMKPRRSMFGEIHKVRDIACGYGFTVFTVKSSSKDVVYGSGINTDSQIGYNASDKKYNDDIINEPRPIELPMNNSAKVLSIAAGRAHLLILTSEGLFTLGNNGYGQCGRQIIANENYNKSRVVHRIPDIKGQKIKEVTAGQDHSILLTEKGEVYTFGWGADGQTGLAHYRNEYRPSVVKGDLAGQHIVKVSCSADCVLALSDKGQVFGWGNSEYGQLEVKDDNQQINIATELKECSKLGRIVDIAAGGCFCMVLNNEGNVYVWGFGILGFGPEIQKVNKPTLLPPALFGANPYERNRKVIKLFCGVSHLAALTNSGDLYMWGCNKFGSLGLGHYNNQYFPLKVAVGAQVEKVACGVDHTVTLCKPYI